MGLYKVRDPDVLEIISNHLFHREPFMDSPFCATRHQRKERFYQPSVRLNEIGDDMSIDVHSRIILRSPNGAR